MKYVLLNYTKAQTAGERRPREMHPAFAAVLQWPDVSGWVRLHPAESATTLRLEGPRQSRYRNAVRNTLLMRREDHAGAEAAGNRRSTRGATRAAGARVGGRCRLTDGPRPIAPRHPPWQASG